MNHRLSSVALAAALLVFAVPSFADDAKPKDPPRIWGEEVSINGSQSSFSSNWAGGDKSSFVWIVGSVTTFDKQVSRRFNLSSKLTLAYGQTEHQSDDPAHPGTLVWDSPDKTTDQVLSENTLRWTRDWVADPYIGFRAETQFNDQSSPLGTLNFNPVKIEESGGGARVYHTGGGGVGTTRLGFTLRETFARSLLAASPRTITSSSSHDGGFEWKTDLKRKVLGGAVDYEGTLLTFWPLYFSNSAALRQFDHDAMAYDPTRQPVADYWRKPSIDFQGKFSAPVTRSLSVNLFTQWVYEKFDGAARVDNSQSIAQRIAEVDRNIRLAGQFKETLAIGFTYKLH